MRENKITIKGFLIWGICSLFFLYEFFLRTVIGAYQCPVMQELNLSSMQFSLLSTTIFFLMHCLMQIPVGIIVDNLGLKRSLVIGSALCFVSTMVFSYSTTYMMAVVARMVMGVGGSFAFICVLVAACDWMPSERTAFFIGLSQFVATLGAIMAAGPLETLSTTMDISWRSLFFFLSILAAILMVLIFCFVENSPIKEGSYTILNKPEKIKVSLYRLISRVQPWYIAIVSAGLYFAVEYFSDNEGRAFLLLKGFSITSASYMLSISWVGYAIGCPLLGFISDFFERRKMIMALSALLTVVVLLMIFYCTGKQQLQIAFFFLGIASSGQNVGFAMMGEQFKKQFIAIGFGLNNAIIGLFSAINAPVIGWLLDTTKKKEVIALGEYIFVFHLSLTIPAVITCIIAIFFIKETYCKSVVTFTILGKKS